jgi:hypothetical protein
VLFYRRGFDMARESGIGKEILALAAFFFLLTSLHRAWAGF